MSVRIRPPACRRSRWGRPGNLPRGLPAATKCGVMERWPCCHFQPAGPPWVVSFLPPGWVSDSVPFWDIPLPPATPQSAAGRMESEPFQNLRAGVGGKPQGPLGLHLCRREKYSHGTTSCDGPRGSLLWVTHTLVAPGHHAHRTPTARPRDSRHCRECRGPLSSSLCGHFHDRQVEDLLKSVFQHYCFALTA